MKRYFYLVLITALVILTQVDFKAFAQQGSLITIIPYNTDLKANDEKIIALKLNSDSKISGFDLKFITSGPVEIVDFVDNLGFSSYFDPFNIKQVTKKIDGTNSRIVYILNSPLSSLPSAVTLYAKIKGGSSGLGKISLSENSQILDGTGKPLKLSPLTATYNLSISQSSPTFIDQSTLPKPSYPDTTAVVNLKIKLYGAGPIARKEVKALAVVTGRIGEGRYETLPQNFKLISDEKGIFSGTVAFPNFKDGNKFSIMLKADKYLLKRICNLDTSEEKLGSYTCKTPGLTIKSGSNNLFDFSQISLIPGDLGTSDGILNGYDLAIVRNNLGKKDLESLNLADLNYDGIVDQKDFEIITFAAANTRRKADK